MIHKHIRYRINGSTKFAVYNFVTGVARGIDGHWRASNFDENLDKVADAVRVLRRRGASDFKLVTYDEGHGITAVQAIP